MGVYIDREEAIKCLDGNVLITRQSEAEAVKEYFEMVIKRLENLPTIDLVRCKECKWREKIEGVLWCNTWLNDTNGVTFCSYGERRTDYTVFTVNPPKGVETPLKGDATVFHKNLNPMR